MSDAPRDVRDRLAEALRLWLAARTGARPQRPELTQIEREYWLKRGGRVAEFEALAASCGLKIVPADGETK